MENIFLKKIVITSAEGKIRYFVKEFFSEQHLKNYVNKIRLGGTKVSIEEPDIEKTYLVKVVWPMKSKDKEVSYYKKTFNNERYFENWSNGIDKRGGFVDEVWEQ